jgi:hypothetical protein
MAFSPEAAAACIDGLQAAVTLQPSQCMSLVSTGGATRLCSMLGQNAFSEEATRSGMELLCMLAWQLRRSGAGACSAIVLPWHSPAKPASLTMGVLVQSHQQA